MRNSRSILKRMHTCVCLCVCVCTHACERQTDIKVLDRPEDYRTVSEKNTETHKGNGKYVPREEKVTVDVVKFRDKNVIE